MLRTYEFYEDEYGFSRNETDRINNIVSEFEYGILNEDNLRSLGVNGLKFCVAEGKIDTLVKLISPIEFRDGYKYVIDAISLNFVAFVNSVPDSIMDRYVKMLADRRAEDIMFGESPFLEPEITILDAAHNAVILTPRMKKEIIDAILNIDMEKVGSMKIKDVMARQVSGMGYPVRSVRDVAYYSEVSNYFPSVALFEKNIATTSNDTTGCYDDCEHTECKCEISIHYDTLDEYNKCVADAIIEKGYGHLFNSFVDGGNDLMISVPCNGDESIAAVNGRMMELISKFHKQDILHGIQDLKEAVKVLKRYVMFLPKEDKIKIQKMIKDDMTAEEISNVTSLMGGYLTYVCEDGVLYKDKYCLDKHREYLIENNLIEKMTME